VDLKALSEDLDIKKAGLLHFLAPTSKEERNVRNKASIKTYLEIDINLFK
jgi:hypothetical protein